MLWLICIHIIRCLAKQLMRAQKKTYNMDRVKRIWYLSPMRAAKVQASLCIRAVSPEPSLLAHTSSESRGTFRQKARSLAPLNGWACAVKICHDGMLEDTNSLDGAQMWILQRHGSACARVSSIRVQRAVDDPTRLHANSEDLSECADCLLYIHVYAYEYISFSFFFFFFFFLVCPTSNIMRFCALLCRAYFVEDITLLKMPKRNKSRLLDRSYAFRSAVLL